MDAHEAAGVTASSNDIDRTNDSVRVFVIAFHKHPQNAGVCALVKYPAIHFSGSDNIILAHTGAYCSAEHLN